MTEKAYVNHTDLRAIRIAKDVIRPIIAMEDSSYREIMRLLRREEERLERWQEAHPLE